MKPVFRMANAKTGQRRYLTSTKTVQKLVRSRWRYEGVAFIVPAKGGKPVYQLKCARETMN